MAATSSSTAFSADHREARESRPAATIIHARRLAATLLTVFSLALGAYFVAAYGRDGMALFFSWLPVALVLMWTSTGALRFDERGYAEAEAERESIDRARSAAPG